jgi:hypothetical protein
VFNFPNSDTYVIFGEAKIEDHRAQSQAAAADNLFQVGNAFSLRGPSMETITKAEAGHE